MNARSSNVMVVTMVRRGLTEQAAPWLPMNLYTTLLGWSCPSILASPFLPLRDPVKDKTKRKSLQACPASMSPGDCCGAPTCSGSAGRHRAVAGAARQLFTFHMSHVAYILAKDDTSAATKPCARVDRRPERGRGVRGEREAAA
jgi:hypothetical protein